MTIFAILLPAPNERLVGAIAKAYPNDHLRLSDTQFLVSSAGTAMEVSARIGVADPAAPQAPSAGSAVIFATTSYYGRAPAPVWDWIKAKLESRPNG
ncbi:MAG TPA: hypothetical protein VMF86_14775 [Stellaceae bacterium]|nr:hypothetical protein [Stellaceae bacterium]